MLEKLKNTLKITFELAKKHYIFAACLIFIAIGFDMLNTQYWGYGDTDGERIGYSISEGLKILAGSMLMGFSLVALVLLKINSSK